MSGIYLFLLGLLCVLVSTALRVGVRKWRKFVVYQGKPVPTDEGSVLRLYQLMKDVHDVCVLHNIPYWIDFGTLLGAMRHQGLIPWDDDLDISIEVKDEQQLAALAPLFKELGYGLISTAIGYKIFYLDGQKVYYQHEDCRFPFIDVYVRQWRGDKLYYVTRNRRKPFIWGRRDGQEIYLKREEVYPFKTYQFGGLELQGPQNPSITLQCLYGNDWYDVAYHKHNHQGKQMTKVKMQLTDKDRVPAQPLGPLCDRVFDRSAQSNYTERSL